MASRKRGRPFGSQLTLSERKERKRKSERERSKEKIYIGEHFNRWNDMKEKLKFMFNYEMAGFLLDSYEHGLEQTKTKAVTSTPMHGQTSKPGFAGTQVISDISAESGNTAPDIVMSGVEEMEPGPSSRKRARQKKKTSSFLDPLELSIDISEESETVEGSDDETYYPSFNISIGPKDVTGIEDRPCMETVLPSEEEKEEDEIEETDEDPGPFISRVLCRDDFVNILENKTTLVYLNQLIALAKKKVDSVCKVKGCGQVLDIQLNHVGSAVYLKWICPNSHVAEKWCSQPVLNRGLHGGDLMISSAILFSGNNFNKMELFAKFMQMGFPNQSSFTRLQRRYLVPAVDQLWDEKQMEMVEEMAEKDLVLLGDGRMDSPGHCAQYCTYTFMDNETKKILSVKTLDKRETERKSANLEKAGFIRGIQEIQDKGLSITEIVTDAHLQIGAMMKKDYSHIKHSHDIWHAAKNLGKKLISAGQEKNCRELQTWSKDIVNHFWYTCKTADNLDEFMGMWVGVLHHVVGEHEWFLPYNDTGVSACSHDPLTGEAKGDKEWMVKGSPPHEALRKVILDKRLLHNIPYYLNFRSTAELESFHNHLLMYSSKRYAYTPPVYRARCILAALDYNENVDRQPIINKDGTVRLQRTYNKKSGRWTVYPVKEKKKYTHVISLFTRVLEKRVEDREGFYGRLELEEGDPRRISKTIAPTLPPPSAQLAEEKKSRFEN
ncbi:uncharacterized protein LOC111134747 [Crassostrea virginica]|uniref:Uncharacterized protein LOC111134747 n=1 Tax=Crassostrea virginica TaxID=6565 RepID=A0A8B8EGN7_CRAVI|nr:uncharacterized protein LOC111134747 [Crassostrea virginica]